MKTILVQADLGKSFRARMQLAVSMAKQQGARVRGLYVIPPFELAGYSKYAFPKAVLEERAAAERAEAESAHKIFEELAAEENIETDWVIEVGDFCDTLCGHGRIADLVLMGQRDPDSPGTVESVAPDRVILRAGRPVLVVPHIAFEAHAGSHILVAWDGSRESARAVHDALPLLQQADEVDVVTFSEPKSEAARVASLDSIIGYLKECDVKAEGESLILDDVPVGEALLNRVIDRSVNMLVMGGYGRSRLREVVLGGVTRTVLEHTSVPVMMSR